MFPRDPRPEWHKHLRFTLQKAGMKLIGKPPEHDARGVPDHLRYQLKQIYVY